MVIQQGKNWYKIGKKAQHPWIKQKIAVFKRKSPFSWDNVEIEFESVEDAKEYIKFADLIGEMQ